MLTHPLFLIGLSAIAIPIIIHLLQLRRYRKVYFSNVDMLDELQSENRRQHNLRKLLILASRILAIVCLVLAFCQPVIPSKQSPMESGATVVSIYLDNSYSMETGGMEGSLIETAKQKAREIAAAYDPGTHFQLLTNNMDGSQFRWLSREELLQAVDLVEAGAVTTPLSITAARQNQFLLSATAGNRHAYLISDFQRSTSDLSQLPADSAVLSTLIPLGGSQLANICLDSLSFTSPAYFPGATVKIDARLRNLSDKPVEKQPLRLFIGNRQQAVTSVDLPANGSATATLTFTIQNDSLLQGHVETTDYPVTFDDRLFFSLPVTSRIPLLVISGQDENPFLKRLFNGDSLTRYLQMPYNALDYARIEDNRLIILDQLHAIPSGLARTLTQFVADGGTLLVIPAPAAETESYNQLLASLQAPQLGSWQKRPVRTRSILLTHPLYQGVFQGRNEDLETPTFTGFYSLSPNAGTVAQPIIELVDGHPALTLTPYAEGRLYLFASPLTPEHTDFIHQALFVPTLYNMALFSSPHPLPYHSLSSSAPIPLSTKPRNNETPRTLTPSAPDNNQTTPFIPDIRHSGSRWYMLPHGEIKQAGTFLLSPAPTEGLAFNYSRDESDLTSYSRNEIKQLLNTASLTTYTLSPPATKSMTDFIRNRSQGTPLWHWFILLTLLFLLVETLLIRLPAAKRGRSSAEV